MAAAIYGDGEERHLPRIISYARAGLAMFSLGPSTTLCDWVYVDNLAHALDCALATLSDPQTADRAGGEPYCISDGGEFFFIYLFFWVCAVCLV